MLELRHVEHWYGDHRVLEIDELRLDAGTVTALVGANASGKSTLLRLMAFLERPTSGTLTLNAQPVVSNADRHHARRRVTLVEQKPLLFRGTVAQNLRYALSLHHATGPDTTTRLTRALERMGIPYLSERPARSLSDGETQRVAIARALALQPDVLLLDEPTSAADRGAVAQLYQLLQEERERGIALCFASHQLEDAYRWSERVISLTGGKAGTVVPENLFRTVIPEGSGHRVVRIGPLDVHLVTDKAGPVTVALPADDILVSLQPFASSVRNQFPGKIIAIADAAPGWVTVRVDTGVDLSARITRGALDELGLTLGTEVILSIKAMAVQVH